MTSDHHAPYVQGFTHATMAGTTGCDAATRSGSLKTGLSSDRSLQLDCVKAESLVIANQQRRGECVPGPCTHRPSHHPSRLHPKSPAQPAREGGAEGVEGKGGEVVTRYPYENVRMDHLLSREHHAIPERQHLLTGLHAANSRPTSHLRCPREQHPVLRARPRTRTLRAA